MQNITNFIVLEPSTVSVENRVLTLTCEQCSRILPTSSIIMNDIGNCLCHPCYKGAPMICEVCSNYISCNKPKGETCEKWSPLDSLFRK